MTPVGRVLPCSPELFFTIHQLVAPPDAADCAQHGSHHRANAGNERVHSIPSKEIRLLAKRIAVRALGISTRRGFSVRDKWKTLIAALCAPPLVIVAAYGARWTFDDTSPVQSLKVLAPEQHLGTLAAGSHVVQFRIQNTSTDDLEVLSFPSG